LLGEDDEKGLASARQAEGRARQARLAGLDDKVLADWNGLMIAAWPMPLPCFQRDELVRAAVTAGAS